MIYIGIYIYDYRDLEWLLIISMAVLGRLIMFWWFKLRQKDFRMEFIVNQYGMEMMNGGKDLSTVYSLIGRKGHSHPTCEERQPISVAGSQTLPHTHLMLVATVQGHTEVLVWDPIRLLRLKLGRLGADLMPCWGRDRDHNDNSQLLQCILYSCTIQFVYNLYDIASNIGKVLMPRNQVGCAQKWRGLRNPFSRGIQF